jgi:hypothetical protein
MQTRTHFTHRIDLWADDGEHVIEHLAGVEDLQVAMATYHAACERWPNAPITLRQGMRVRLHTQANFLGRQTLTEERKFCWSKLSNTKTRCARPIRSSMSDHAHL